jgi:hypothetical protein
MKMKIESGFVAAAHTASTPATADRADTGEETRPESETQSKSKSECEWCPRPSHEHEML